MRIGQLSMTPPNSSIRGHALKAGYDINLRRFEICHKNYKTLSKISESNLNRKFNPYQNNKDSSTKINIPS